MAWLSLVTCSRAGECRKKTYHTSGLIPIRQKPVKILRNTAHKYLGGGGQWWRHGSNTCAATLILTLSHIVFRRISSEPEPFSCSQRSPRSARLLVPPSWHITSHLSETHLWGTEIVGTSPPRLLNFAHQSLIFIGLRYGTGYTSQFWRLEFFRWLLHFWKICGPPTLIHCHCLLITYRWEQTRSRVGKLRAAGLRLTIMLFN
jgi:hypothetical protein